MVPVLYFLSEKDYFKCLERIMLTLYFKIAPSGEREQNYNNYTPMCFHKYNARNVFQLSPDMYWQKDHNNCCHDIHSSDV